MDDKIGMCFVLTKYGSARYIVTELCRYTQIINTKEFEIEQANPNTTEKFKLQIIIPIVATMQEFHTSEDLHSLPKVLANPTVIVTNGDSDTRTLKEDIHYTARKAVNASHYF